MLYKIVEVSTDKASGHTYVLVHFWRDKAAFDALKSPDRINDFLMQLWPTGERPIDPNKPGLGSVIYDRDLPTEIKANIEAYWERAEEKGYPPDHTNAHIERDNSDLHGILAWPDVTALRGAEVEKP